MVSVLVWSRDDAANYLGLAAGVLAADLLVSNDLVRASFDDAIVMHINCGCERARRLTVARDILLGDGQPVTDCQGRLL